MREVVMVVVTGVPRTVPQIGLPLSLVKSNRLGSNPACSHLGTYPTIPALQIEPLPSKSALEIAPGANSQCIRRQPFLCTNARCLPQK
jgi:hypothetical protein